MTTSRNIAALLGPVCFLTGAFVLLNLAAFPAILADMAAHPTLMLLAGYMTFVPGLAIVVWHNRWQGGWPVAVTVLGWLFLAVGTLRVLLAYRLSGQIAALGPLVQPALPVLGLGFLGLGGWLSVMAWRGR